MSEVIGGNLRHRHDILDAEELQKTILRLTKRISERFPNSGLSGVCHTLHKISLKTHETLQDISRPNQFMRILAWVVIAGILGATVYSLSAIHLQSGGISISDLVQMFGSALEGLAIAGAGIVFIVSFENRRRRIRIIGAVNRLRCMAHIIDIHQLAKDPEVPGSLQKPTVSSPRRNLTPYLLGRYLDYCSEMLALTSKLAFLYVQEFPDAVATNAVNDLEKLTTDLSRKIWQKIVLIPRE